MSSYKALTQAPSNNSVGDITQATSTPSSGWIQANTVLSQTTQSELYAKVGLIDDGNFSSSWSPCNIPNLDPNATYQGVAYLNNLYLAGGQVSSNPPPLATSTDGVSWTSRTSNGATNQIITGFAYNNEYVAVGANAYISTSTDGITWTVRTASSTNNIENIIYGGGQYVYVGWNSTYGTSTDAITWSGGTITSTAIIFWDVVYGNSLYAATTSNGRVYTSTDAVTWTQRSVPVPTTATDLRGIVYTSGTYLVVGDIGFVATSTDAVTWSRRTTSQPSGATLPSFYGVDYTDGLAIATGSDGFVYYSYDLTTWVPTDFKVGASIIYRIANNNGHYVVGSTLNGIYNAYRYTYDSTTEFVAPLNLPYATSGSPSKLYIKGE